MMWDQVLSRIATVVQTDQALRAIYADHMRMAGVGQIQVPSLEWTLVGDAEEELFAPVIVQFDQWHTSMPKIVLSERRLRSLFHAALPVEFDGLVMWSQYLDGDTLATTDRNNFNGRAVRFRFTPLRSRYALSTLTP